MGQLEKESDYFMSIDYSDMAFPKPKKKKKRISHPKSILNTERACAISVPICMETIGSSIPRNTMYCLDPG